MKRVETRKAIQRAQQMSREDVLAELRQHGINDLHDLVDARLREIQGTNDEVQGYEMEEDWVVLVYSHCIIAKIG